MKTTWISHRGYKKRAVENTCEAFEDAIAHGFSALETDLRLSRDGHIVLHHDEDLTRLAQIDTKIGELTRKELSQITLRERDVSGRILFLDQFIKKFPGCSWVFDIKPESGSETIRALYAWSKSEGIYEWVSAQSKFLLWKRSDELLLKSLFPMVHCYAQKKECWQAGLGILFGLSGLADIQADRTYSIPPSLGPIGLFKKSIVGAYHRQGAKVLAFLPEAAKDVRLAVAAGVDEILTNGLPEQANTLLDDSKS